MQAAMDARGAAEVSSAAPASATLENTVRAFGSRCNYEWVDDSPHGCYREDWCEPECDPEPQCDPVALRQSGDGCDRPCEPLPPSVASAENCDSTARCETDAWCEPKTRYEKDRYRETKEWCETKPYCDEEPSCDSVPTVASSKRCESRPACEVQQQCDPYQNGAKSARGKEYCDPCENTDARKRGGRGEGCEVRGRETWDRCEPKQRCDTAPRCDDNVPARVASENVAKQSRSDQSAASISGQQSADTAQRVAQAAEKCFGDTNFMNQIAHLL